MEAQRRVQSGRDVRLTIQFRLLIRQAPSATDTYTPHRSQPHSGRSAGGGCTVDANDLLMIVVTKRESSSIAKRWTERWRLAAKTLPVLPVFHLLVRFTGTTGQSHPSNKPTRGQSRGFTFCTLQTCCMTTTEYLHYYSPEAKHSFGLGRIMKILYGAKNGVQTPSKMSRLGWNLKHCEHILGGWPWQILGAIRTVATVWEAGEILFVFLSGKQRMISPIFRLINLRNFNTTTSIGVAM